ncbi:MAG: SDR family NAD(P)-dependent oxidoreductase [Betaproteobacteria bacterium]|nr:SDR family NAD(P)-dependent oxidoreductase [Betaproteobacteria bacterium]
MTSPLQRPRRKNPILRTRLPTRPPGARSRVALGMTAAAARGEFQLQVCADCKAVQYPPREACHVCLSEKLRWSPQDGGGELVSETILHLSYELFFRERTPWRLGMVRLDSGPIVIAHLHRDCPPALTRVKVSACLDKAGQAALFAVSEKETPNMADDPQLREMTCDPRFRKVFVTDGKTAVGQAIVRGLAAAGADLIWVGHAEPWKKYPGLEELKQLPQVTLLPFDLTNGRSVKEICGEIGGRVDIVVNNAEYHRNFGIQSRQGIEVARAEMDVNYFGLLRLAQELAPAMRARAADGQSSAVAWVNLLSIFALSNFPPHGTYSASKAAAHSLAQCLRAEMQPAGLRVINVYPGPIEDEWNQMLLPPKLTPQAVANAIVRALQGGVEDVYPGDVAQDWLARWRDNPKALEREVAAG